MSRDHLGGFIGRSPFSFSLLHKTGVLDKAKHSHAGPRQVTLGGGSEHGLSRKTGSSK